MPCCAECKWCFQNITGDLDAHIAEQHPEFVGSSTDGHDLLRNFKTAMDRKHQVPPKQEVRPEMIGHPTPSPDEVPYLDGTTKDGAFFNS
jgi:hypothetical protein